MFGHSVRISFPGLNVGYFSNPGPGESLPPPLLNVSAATIALTLFSEVNPYLFTKTLIFMMDVIVILLSL